MSPTNWARFITRVAVRLGSSGRQAADDAERLALIQRAFEERAVFVSPEGMTVGSADTSASIGAFRKAFPKSRVPLGEVDNPSDDLRFLWTMAWGDRSLNLIGCDAAQMKDSFNTGMSTSSATPWPWPSSTRA